MKTIKKILAITLTAFLGLSFGGCSFINGISFVNDNFGLDNDDLDFWKGIVGFDAWFFLQRYDRLPIDFTPQPFVTYIAFEQTLNGTI